MHDISDGGLFTTVLEMAISGWSGVNLDINIKHLLRSTLENPELNMISGGENIEIIVQQMMVIFFCEEPG